MTIQKKKKNTKTKRQNSLSLLSSKVGSTTCTAHTPSSQPHKFASKKKSRTVHTLLNTWSLETQNSIREREKNTGAGATEQASKQGGEERRRRDRVRTEASSRRCAAVPPWVCVSVPCVTSSLPCVPALIVGGITNVSFERERKREWVMNSVFLYY